MIYGVKGHDSTTEMEAAIDIRGLSSSLTPVSDLEEIKGLGITDQIRAAGILEPDGMINLPFVAVDGKLHRGRDFNEELKRLPVTNIREHEDPYIIAYGVTGCPHTRQGTARLEANDIPYEFRDISDERYRGRHNVLMREQKSEYCEYPLLDISGRIFCNPSIEVVRANFR